MIVPVVPIAETKWVIVPLVSAPDFRASRFVMCLGVVAVGKLIEHQVAVFGGSLSRVVDRSFHGFVSRRENDFGSERTHR